MAEAGHAKRQHTWPHCGCQWLCSAIVPAPCWC
jgi:hypothetical protein